MDIQARCSGWSATRKANSPVLTGHFIGVNEFAFSIYGRTDYLRPVIEKLGVDTNRCEPVFEIRQERLSFAYPCCENVVVTLPFLNL